MCIARELEPQAIHNVQFRLINVQNSLFLLTERGLRIYNTLTQHKETNKQHKLTNNKTTKPLIRVVDLQANDDVHSFDL